MKFKTLIILSLTFIQYSTCRKNKNSKQKNEELQIMGDSITNDLDSMFLHMDISNLNIQSVEQILELLKQEEILNENGSLESMEWNEEKANGIKLLLGNIFTEKGGRLKSIEGAERFPELQTVMQKYASLQDFGDPFGTVYGTEFTTPYGNPCLTPEDLPCNSEEEFHKSGETELDKKSAPKVIQTKKIKTAKHKPKVTNITKTYGQADILARPKVEKEEPETKIITEEKLNSAINLQPTGLFFILSFSIIFLILNI
ncbi:hypothetical protein TBLA_0B04050 [Henningerozyma blattae CBS 6284]|uniref:Uncharacterized protein n=1 Tax=Henningerozyma blattae (strain ATCC 34711 / CBS 6284 / DSM 70876 / NBRC 10599 / NRRL Y-10934 / UCD 77-7) TaxID=1071380 RepID=I2GYP1_HENB6|nr:hypothetical protein TBLA_0B04050 [Tetrapisispora blattae CBS 6284]CCH59243.1 hypothetical protein TBLA_0B04050 [Tetrapisispora blattae CBS 6284]